MMFGNIFDDIKDAVTALPKTQADIRELAQATKQARSPETEQMIREVKGELQTYATVTMALQVASTIAIVGLFMINLDRHRNGR